MREGVYISVTFGENNDPCFFFGTKYLTKKKEKRKNKYMMSWLAG